MVNRKEVCSVCDGLTGHAGAGDGSIFWLDGAIGPLCNECNTQLRNEVLADSGVEEFLAKFPKTADGVQWYGQPVWIVTGDKYVISNEQVGQFVYNYWKGKKEWQAEFNYGYGIITPVRYCFSTQEAALAAELGTNGK